MAKAFPQYDLDEEDDHTIAMREGMRALLAMHNQHELDNLCTSLQVEKKGRNAQKINRLFNQCLNNENDYDRVLSMMWEGTLVEYLRSAGLPMREVKEADPRRSVIELWRKRDEERSEFTDLYMPTIEQPKRAETVEDPTMLVMLGDIKEHEKILRHCEHKIRTEKGFKGVMAFFATLTSLRNVEMEGRRYLMQSVDNADLQLFEQRRALVKASGHLHELEDQHEEFAHESAYGNAMNAVMKKMFFQDGAALAAQRRMMQNKWAKAEAKYIEETEKLKKDIARNKERHAKAAAEEQGGVKEYRTFKRKYDKLKAAWQLTCAKLAELKERYQTFGASDEMMMDVYFTMAANENRVRADYEDRIQRATPTLLKMLRSDNPVPKSDFNMLADRGERMLLTLGVFDKQSMMEQKEHIAMWKEELYMARILAMREAKRKKPKKKKPKKQKSATEKREAEKRKIIKARKKAAKKRKKKKGKGKKGKGKKKKKK